ncbi:MAG TPA: hypothetical protein VEX14_04660 [Burkholderiaceae bacterium]|nr:hypothetical protein [Burkholderiaceae bacterium]
MSEPRVEQLLEEANALKREALAVQRESLALQKDALAEQRKLIDDTRANLEIARGVNERAAELQTKARPYPGAAGAADRCARAVRELVAVLPHQDLR